MTFICIGFEVVFLIPFLFQAYFTASVCNFIKIETLAQVFSCEFCEISKKIFFTEHLRATASEMRTLAESEVLLFLFLALIRWNEEEM